MSQKQTEFFVSQIPPPGTATGDIEKVPSIFCPLTIKDMTLSNRFVVSPM